MGPTVVISAVVFDLLDITMLLAWVGITADYNFVGFIPTGKEKHGNQR
jgi:hypothetical protein